MNDITRFVSFNLQFYDTIEVKLIKLKQELPIFLKKNTYSHTRMTRIHIQF